MYKEKYEKYESKINDLIGGKLCSNGCGRPANPKYRKCCPKCPFGQHTQICDARYKSVLKVHHAPHVRQYIEIIAHPFMGNRSVEVLGYNFKYDLNTLHSNKLHVEILKKTSQDRSLLPPIKTKFNVGQAYLLGDAIMRPVMGLYRQDGHQAHVTVYYGVDAVNKFRYFK
jgi:hypothetical protein